MPELVLRYRDATGVEQYLKLPQLFLGTQGECLAHKAGEPESELSELAVPHFVDQDEHGLLKFPMFRPLSGELVCRIAGVEIARSSDGFVIERAQPPADDEASPGVDELIDLSDGSSVAFADWLAGKWMIDFAKKDSLGDPRDERLEFIHAAYVDAPDVGHPGLRTRPSALSN